MRDVANFQIKKVLLLGAKGSLGSGISEVIKASGEFNVFEPTSSELDLTDKHETEKYFLMTYPDIVIHSAGKTANKNTSALDEIKFAQNNIEIITNLIQIAKKFDVNYFIHFGSASIYQNWEYGVINENKFLSTSRILPKYPYTISKYEESLRILQEVNKGKNFYSIILPYVLGDIRNSKRAFNNLFNRISEQYLQSLLINKPSSVDYRVGRQIVCARSVGELCKYIIKGRLNPGIIHFPGNELISLNYFIRMHEKYLGINIELENMNQYTSKPKNLLSTSRVDIQNLISTFSTERFVKETIIDKHGTVEN
jgi:nucleoside-diphosphate-sugar epimerase